MAGGPRADTLEAQLAAYRALVAPSLTSALDGLGQGPSVRALSAAAGPTRGSGCRPGLCMAPARALGAAAPGAVPFAAALEMLHDAFLVHDDIEDGSESRRGEPAMHVAHGLPLALNAGDAMLALSTRIFREGARPLAPHDASSLLEEFDHLLMQSLEGKAMELGWIRDNNCSFSDDDYLRLVLKKTSYYSFIHPCRIGAVLARGGGYDLARFDRFGSLLGAAFQIQDDVLNLAGDRAKYGKEIGGDLWEGKRTLVLAHLLRQVDADDAQRITALLGQPRSTKAAADVDWLHDLTRARGSIDYARQAARELAEAAQQELPRAFADAHEGPDLDFVRKLVSYCVERDV